MKREQVTNKLSHSLISCNDEIHNVRVLGLMVKDIESNIQVVDRLEREFLQYTPAGQSYDSGRELVFSFYGVRFFGIMGFRPILRADNMLKKEGRKLMVV